MNSSKNQTGNVLRFYSLSSSKEMSTTDSDSEGGTELREYMF